MARVRRYDRSFSLKAIVLFLFISSFTLRTLSIRDPFRVPFTFEKMRLGFEPPRISPWEKRFRIARARVRTPSCFSLPSLTTLRRTRKFSGWVLSQSIALDVGGDVFLFLLREAVLQRSTQRLTIGVSRPLAFPRCRSSRWCFRSGLHERFQKLVVAIR